VSGMSTNSETGMRENVPECEKQALKPALNPPDRGTFNKDQQ